MRGTGVAVDAAMLTPSVNIDAGVEDYIGTFAGGNKRPGGVLEEVSFRGLVFMVD